MADKTMIAGKHILEKIRSEGVIFSCCYYYYYYIYFYSICYYCCCGDIRYKICSTLASDEDPIYQKYM